MINKETIISVYNEKLTLLQWLKTINKALDEAVLTNVEITQRGNATFVFVFTFEDGTQVESNEIIVNQGESIVGATIQNGHLLLTLSNDDVLDAGNVKPVSSFSFNAQRHLIVNYADGTTQDLGLIKGVSGFSIDANQHLIVSYDNGTTEDLGAIFSGNVNIDGTLNATKVTGNEIVESMNNYSFAKQTPTGFTLEYVYAGIVKNGNKLTAVIAMNITRTDTIPDATNVGRFNIPSAVSAKLYPVQIGGYNVLDMHKVNASSDGINFSELLSRVYKGNNEFSIFLTATTLNTLTLNTKYFVRYEVTFLLSDNLASE